MMMITIMCLPMTENILVQPESINDTYLEEQSDTNITINSLDMSTNGETVDQDDDDLAKERDLLASLIKKLKCEIDDSKNRNKFLESSNKTLVDKLKARRDNSNHHRLRDAQKHMTTKIELTMEQSQQGVSDDVLVSIEGVEELKRNVWIKGENKEALHIT
ncbi:hypothetical protein Tco_0083930 [Tanacetum coccineum]